MSKNYAAANKDEEGSLSSDDEERQNILDQGPNDRVQCPNC